MGYEWHKPYERRWVTFTVLTFVAIIIGGVILLDLLSRLYIARHKHLFFMKWINLIWLSHTSPRHSWTQMKCCAWSRPLSVFAMTA